MYSSLGLIKENMKKKKKKRMSGVLSQTINSLNRTITINSTASITKSLKTETLYFQKYMS